MTPELRLRLVRDAAALYRPAGRFAWHFARGKLAGDPLFPALLRHGLIPDGARIADLGCGQGLLGAWLLAARRLAETGGWPGNLPVPPQIGSYLGAELMPADADRARRALGRNAVIVNRDLRALDWGPVDVAILLDVIHFLDFSAQEALLERICRSLFPKGLLLMRIADAAGGASFWLSQAVDHGVAWCRGHGWPRFHCRSQADWVALLDRLGFQGEWIPMREGNPFANGLIVARPAVMVGQRTAAPATRESEAGTPTAGEYASRSTGYCRGHSGNGRRHPPPLRGSGPARSG